MTKSVMLKLDDDCKVSLENEKGGGDLYLSFGTLYPAYASYKAVKNKNVKEYVKWMMYWIVFALFTCAETFADLFLAWFPFYYEIKIIFVLWLLSPATKGSSILYRRFVHPHFAKREEEIDAYIAQASEQGYYAVVTLGSKGLSYAANMVVQGQQKIVEHIKNYNEEPAPAAGREGRGREGGSREPSRQRSRHDEDRNQLRPRSARYEYDYDDDDDVDYDDNRLYVRQSSRERMGVRRTISDSRGRETVSDRNLQAADIPSANNNENVTEKPSSTKSVDAAPVSS